MAMAVNIHIARAGKTIAGIIPVGKLGGIWRNIVMRPGKIF
jgi:hypothetical protein